MFNLLTMTHSKVLPTADYTSTNLYRTSMHDRCSRNEACSWVIVYERDRHDQHSDFSLWAGTLAQ